MKLRKMQQGGGLIYTPFIPGMTGIQQGSSSKIPSGNDDESAKLDVLDKELTSLIQSLDGNPNEINKIVNMATMIQRRSQHLSALGGTEAYRTIMPQVIQLTGEIQKAKQFKEIGKIASGNIAKEHASNEVALDSYGKMYVQNENGEIEKIKPSEFDREKHIPISNSQLMNLRRSVPQLAFDDSILNDLTNVVGKDTIAKEIDRIIGQYGTKENAHLFSKNEAANAGILLMSSPDGIYKITTKQEVDDLDAAAKMLFLRLPDNMQKVLKADAVLHGLDPDKGAIEVIKDTVYRNTNRSRTVDYDSTASKAAGAGGGDGGDGTLKNALKNTYAERLVMGRSMVDRDIIIEQSNSGAKLWVKAKLAGPVLKDEKRFMTANLNHVFSEADAIGSIIDAQNISFGDQLIDSHDFSQVVYDNGAQMLRVWMPVYTDETGHMRIDFRAQEKLSTLQKYIDDNKYVSKALIEKELEGIDGAYWDDDLKIVRFKNMHPFLVIRGWVSSDKLENFDTNSNYVRKVERGDGDPRADIKRMYNNAINNGTETEGKAAYDNGKAKGRHLYEGNIYMPISDELVATLIYNNEITPQSTYIDVAQQVQERERRMGLKTNFEE